MERVIPAADRIFARLAALDHTALLAYAAELSSAHRLPADALLAKHSPLPDWARDEVLLSTDLLPKVFASLQLDNGAAASVCHAWKDAWVATNEGRRGLRPVELGDPDFEVAGRRAPVAELPNGKAIVLNSTMARIVGSNMKTLQVLKMRGVCVVASATHLFVGLGMRLRRYDLDGFIVTHHFDSEVLLVTLEDQLQCVCFDCLVLAQGDLLFALAYADTDGREEVVCFDARTLEVRKRFGRGRFSAGAFGMAVAGSELLVCNRGTNSIDVFSLAGVYLRSIRGDYRAPIEVLHHDGRLYILEEYGKHPITERCLADDDSLSEERKKALEQVMRRRILVTTLEGDTLQEWKMPEQQGHFIVQISMYDRKLLVNVEIITQAPGSASSSSYKFKALQGI